MTKKASPLGNRPEPNIPPEQWDLPVSFEADGKMVTLRQAMEPGHGPVVPPGSLSPKQRADLTAKRIEAQPQFELAIITAGVINQQRAIHEIRAQSDISRVLIEIEMLLIQNLLDRAMPS